MGRSEQAMKLTMDKEVRGDALIIRLKGELDHHTSEMLKQELTAEIEKANKPYFILSLRQLSFMDSSGLGVILGRYKQIVNQGGKMIVCHANPSVYRLFELSGLFKILTFQENEETALANLGVVS
jgi:stage II sporulation protein AA (anti-sigma F factor antagonist)